MPARLAIESWFVIMYSCLFCSRVLCYRLLGGTQFVSGRCNKNEWW